MLLAQDIVDSEKFGYGSKLTLSVSWRRSLSSSGAPNEVSAPVSRSHFHHNITSVYIAEACSEQCTEPPGEHLGAYSYARTPDACTEAYRGPSHFQHTLTCYYRCLNHRHSACN